MIERQNVIKVPSFIFNDKFFFKERSVAICFVEIYNLIDKDNSCVVQLNYFAKKFNVSTRTIIRWLKKLEENSYITKEHFGRQGIKICIK